MPTMVHILHALESKATKDNDAGVWAKKTLEVLHSGLLEQIFSTYLFFDLGVA
jgi:hypothetical protein